MIGRFLEYLEGLELRPLDEQFLRDFWPMVVEIVRNPASNPPAAIVLLLIAITLMLIIGMAVMLFITRIGSGEEEEHEYVVLPAEGAEETGPATPAEVRYVKDPLRHHRAVIWTAAAVVLVLLAGGVSSQSRSVCLSCHDGIAHTSESAGDSHQAVRCTQCHEPGGRVRSITLSVPGRMAHIFAGLFETDRTFGYGPVVGRSCRNCHAGVADEVVEIQNRALLVSHKEPLEAGAGCMDCHVLDGDAKVGQATKGMSTCLRCHDDTEASAACSTCHTGDVSMAVLAKAGLALHQPRQIIAQPDCYTCHDPDPCDSCHGVRLPHPEQYDWTHMYDAAEDIWFNAGQICYSCHTEERNSCYQAGCHEAELAYHYTRDPTFPRTHGIAAAYPRALDPDVSMECDGCHLFAGNFETSCEMCHRR